MPCVSEVVNRSLKADCTDFNKCNSTPTSGTREEALTPNPNEWNQWGRQPTYNAIYIYIYTQFYRIKCGGGSERPPADNF